MTGNEAERHAEIAEVARLLLLVGKVLLQSGAGASRVEETMMRMGLACGLDSVNVYCTLTGFFVTLVQGDDVITRLLTVKRHGTDLGRIAALNELSRRMERADIRFDEAMETLRDMVLHEGGYPYPLRLLARGLSSGAFAVLMGGAGLDFVPAMIAGVSAQLVYGRIVKLGPEFVAIYFSALAGTLLAVMLGYFGLGNLKFVTVGMMMPLVPGMALTNSIRDLIFGDLLSGVSRAAEATLSAAAIAGGVYTILAWFHFSLWI
jgi:uncharacterized membrane protein YjjP (DUF1212 family)